MKRKNPSEAAHNRQNMIKFNGMSLFRKQIEECFC